MIQKITKSLICLVAVLGFAVAPATTAYAAKIDINDANQEVSEEACKNVNDCNPSSPLGSVFSNVTNVILFLVGAVAVIMLIIGGFRYVMSNGDAGAIKGAKDTILYAIIGIVVAFLAYAAVNFITDQLTKGAS